MNPSTNKPILNSFFLGNTGLKVSPLAFGAFKLGRNSQVKYPEGDGYRLCKQKQINELINKIFQLGINLIDVAPSYGNSELKVGKALKKLKLRHQFIISTKVGEIFDGNSSCYDFSKKHIIKSVENSLRLLGGDRLEIVFLHCPKEDLKVIQSTDALSVLNQLKKEGKIGAIGISTMSEQGGLLAAELADVLMVSFNLKYQKELSVIQKAQRLAKGVVIKKALLSGHLSDRLLCDSESLIKPKSNPTVAECLSTVFQTTKANSVVIGSHNINHLIENANIVSRLTHR